MTADELIARVNDSIIRALRGESVLDQQVLDIKGFSTGIQRRLVSNLAHGLNYLEVGVHTGSSFCAAANNNPKGICVGIENWSQDFSYGDVKSQFESNLQWTGNKAPTVIAERDCFGELPACYPIDVFYFDGEHSTESHRKALAHFLPVLAPDFIYMVDDFDWGDVALGVEQGFTDCAKHVTVQQRWHLTDGRQDGPKWHNGVLLAVVSKI